MAGEAAEKMLQEFEDGRTDLVFELLRSGIASDLRNGEGVSLVQTCAYFGDVSAIRFLLEHGATLASLGENLDLNGAAFHGHWRLCKFLLEHGANVNHPSSPSGETALHSALCTTDRVAHDRVVEVLVAHGADPNLATVDGMETGGFMRDCRTKGETALHRAAAFGDLETIEMLIAAGARVEVRDAHEDTPLAWASWYLRPDPILSRLCYGTFRIRPNRRSMRANALGFPRA